MNLPRVPITLDFAREARCAALEGLAYARSARCAVLTRASASGGAALALFRGTAAALSAAGEGAGARAPRLAGSPDFARDARCAALEGLAYVRLRLTARLAYGSPCGGLGRFGVLGAAALSMAVASGCTINDGKYLRPRELSPITLVDRLRILAVVAEPPEVAPGEEATFSALVADPENDLPYKAWLACPPEQSTSFGCAVDISQISEDSTPEELAELGVIGFEPGFAPRYTADAALLDGLDENARREGIYVTIQLAAFPVALMNQDPEEVDYNAVEVAYKRLVVSEASTPNRNPWMDAFTVDGVTVPDGAVIELDAGEPYEIGVVIPDDAIETYEYLTSEGVLEERVEEPYVDWYCTVDGLGEGYTLHPFTEADFVPAEPGDATCWAVARDRRGGMAWWEQHFTIR